MFSGLVFLQPAAFRAYMTRGGGNWGLGGAPANFGRVVP